MTEAEFSKLVVVARSKNLGRPDAERNRVLDTMSGDSARIGSALATGDGSALDAQEVRLLRLIRAWASST